MKKCGFQAYNRLIQNYFHHKHLPRTYYRAKHGGVLSDGGTILDDSKHKVNVHNIFLMFYRRD